MASSSSRILMAGIVIVIIFVGVGFTLFFLMMNQTPTTTTTTTAPKTSTTPTTTWPTSTTTTYTSTFNTTTQTTTIPTRTLTILTRYDVAVRSVFETAFLSSDFAVTNHITSINWNSASSAFWNDIIMSGAVDVCWGGGETLYNQLSLENLLLTLEGPTINSIVSRINNSSLEYLLHYDDDSLKWIGSSITSFGITINEDYLDTYSLPTPVNWTDLGNATYGSYLPSVLTIGMANAPASTSNLQIYQIILQSQGWDAGWELLTRIAGSSNIYGGSVESQSACENGDVGVSMSIDFYGYLSQFSNPDCRYIIPSDGAYIESEPIAIANETSNMDLALGFIDFVMSPLGQSLWLDDNIRRLPSMQEAFEEPLGLVAPDMYSAYNNTIGKTPMEFNITQSVELQDSVRYYFESVLTNAHDELVQCWNAMIQAYYDLDITKEEFEYFAGLMGAPVTIQDPYSLSNRVFDMDYAIEINSDLSYDSSYRNQVMTAWTNAAMLQYADVYSQIQAWIA